MTLVATLTLNPTIDSASEAVRVEPTRKIRTFGDRYDPGGGGINVARVLVQLGERVEAIYLDGGLTGAMLDKLLRDQGIPSHPIVIAGNTRMSLTVFERATGQEYRFVPEGPLVEEAEWRAALDYCAALKPDWLVASGSLPRGVPDDFIGQLVRGLAGSVTRLVIDTSGLALQSALGAANGTGRLFLVKSSQGEFEELMGRRFARPEEIGAAAQELVRAGKAEHVAVTLGEKGAVLAHAGGVIVRPAASVTVKSATGAGDSFVAGMLHGFLAGGDVADAFRWGMAAGGAAVAYAGTALCTQADVKRLYEELG